MNNTTDQKKFIGMTESRFNIITATQQPRAIDEKKDGYFFSMPPFKQEDKKESQYYRIIG
jgi:hypothetical protein